MRERRFVFDYVLDHLEKQETLYELTVQKLLPGVLDGFNATVFAYGATGAGKTYTMIGTPSHPGVMVQTLAELFQRIAGDDPANEGMEFRVVFSYLEVYNEIIRDLLTPGDDLDVREDPIRGVCIPGVTEFEVASAEDIMDLLRRGNRNRSQEATGANAYSSRSHAVLQVRIEQRDRAPGTEEHVKTGKLSLVDLAGSERASKTNNRGQRMLEGAKINRSLLALGNCINALGDRNGNKQHIPFRDSKLTRLLKDSLGGNCRTTMIANVSPSILALEESINTLKYASRAKNIQMRIERNVDKVSAAIEQYTAIIADLRQEVAHLRNKLIEAGQDLSARPIPPPHIVAGANDEDERKMLERCCASIKHNSSKRTEMRRSLIDLEDMQTRNIAEVTALRGTVDAWEGGRSEDEPKEVRMARMEIGTIEANMKKNDELRVSLVERLQAHEAEASRQAKQYPIRFSNRDKRALVDAEFKIRALEYQRMEFEEHALLNEAYAKEREEKLSALADAITLRDRVICVQREVLEAESISPSDTLKDAHAKLDVEKLDAKRLLLMGRPSLITIGVGRQGGGGKASFQCKAASGPLPLMESNHSPPASPELPAPQERRAVGIENGAGGQTPASSFHQLGPKEEVDDLSRSSVQSQRRTALEVLNRRKARSSALGALSARGPPRITSGRFRSNSISSSRGRISLDERPSKLAVQVPRRQYSAGPRRSYGASRPTTSPEKGSIGRRRSGTGPPVTATAWRYSSVGIRRVGSNESLVESELPLRPSDGLVNRGGYGRAISGGGDGRTAKPRRAALVSSVRRSASHNTSSSGG